MRSDLHNTWYESDPQPLICHVSLNLPAHGICIQTLHKMNDAGGDCSSRPSWKHSHTRLSPRWPSIIPTNASRGSWSCHDHPSTNLALKRWHCCFTAYVTFFQGIRSSKCWRWSWWASLFSVCLIVIPVLLPLLWQSLAATLTLRTQAFGVNTGIFTFKSMYTLASLISKLFGNWPKCGNFLAWIFFNLPDIQVPLLFKI